MEKLNAMRERGRTRWKNVPKRYSIAFSEHTILANHPVTQEIFREMNRQRMTINYVSYVSGVPVDTIREWNRKDYRQYAPKISTVDPVLRVLGLELFVRKVVK